MNLSISEPFKKKSVDKAKTMKEDQNKYQNSSMKGLIRIITAPERLVTDNNKKAFEATTDVYSVKLSPLSIFRNKPFAKNPGLNGAT